ncbi:MAG TPA: 16S rRNA (cytosine(1402)-N(4))-methyltransferase RsmH [Candidatus Woesebacteria bacterium]|nr:16S rRNA (cytosine(1402)-N(4))-methyltransferase RsmH [Candidatus Woesebacteria bacterium]
MNYHYPVLLSEVIDFFQPQKDQVFIDATLGNGGHTLELLKHGSIVWGIDTNQQNLETATQRISESNLSTKFHPLLSNFNQLENISSQINQPINGILFDLGLSTNQILNYNLGFSFKDDLLDMRLNPNTSLTAQEIVNTYDQSQLVELFSYYSQELLSVQIAKDIIHQRQQKPITSASRLAEIIKNTYQNNHRRSEIHPATKVFMALRIEVNQEYQNLKQALISTLKLQPLTKIAIITFHSGEDRIVKNFINQSKVKNLLIKPIKPSFSEIKINPPSRSAILRGYEIIES